MTKVTASQIAAYVYEGMDKNRQSNDQTFRDWDDDPKIAAYDAVTVYKEGTDYEELLADDDDLNDAVVEELVDLIEHEMELEYDDGGNVFKPLNFTHVAIVWDAGLAYIAEGHTAAEAMDAFRKDVSPDLTSDGLTFYKLTTYEADRIDEMSMFNRIIVDADVRKIAA